MSLPIFPSVLSLSLFSPRGKQSTTGLLLTVLGKQASSTPRLLTASGARTARPSAATRALAATSTGIGHSSGRSPAARRRTRAPRPSRAALPSTPLRQPASRPRSTPSRRPRVSPCTLTFTPTGSTSSGVSPPPSPTIAQEAKTFISSLRLRLRRSSPQRSRSAVPRGRRAHLDREPLRHELHHRPGLRHPLRHYG